MFYGNRSANSRNSKHSVCDLGCLLSSASSAYPGPSHRVSSLSTDAQTSHCSDFSLGRHFLQLCPEALPGQERDIVPPASLRVVLWTTFRLGMPWMPPWKHLLCVSNCILLKAGTWPSSLTWPPLSKCWPCFQTLPQTAKVTCVYCIIMSYKFNL